MPIGKRNPLFDEAQLNLPKFLIYAYCFRVSALHGSRQIMVSRPRYEILDGLRGIAAIGVMFFHLSILGLPIVHHGYLAVDFFFILSGFVLSHSHADTHSTISFYRFLQKRLIRILPLSIFGLMLGTSYFLLRAVTQSQSLYSLQDIISGTLFNVFLLPKPWITLAPTDTVFPSNTPLWSLSLEVFTNFIWFLFLFRAKQFTILSIVFLSAIFLCILTIYYGTTDIGATWRTYIGGVSRVTFGFFMGVMIWRYRPQPIKSDLYAASATVALICILMAPDLGPVFDVVAVIILFPSIIFFASCTNYRSERRAYRFLGNISYPLYTIHVPIFMFTAGFAKLLTRDSYGYAIIISSVFVCLIMAFLLDTVYDRTVRRIINKVFIS